MRVLGIETAGAIVGAAVCDDSAVLAEARFYAARGRHSEMLLPMIDRILQETGGLDRLEGIAVSLGPGSFTSIRVGLSVAKGLALARRLPIGGVPTLRALALQAARSQEFVEPQASNIVEPQASNFKGDLRIVAMTDAQRGEVYAAIFRPSGERLTQDAVGTVERFLEGLSDQAVFVGDAAMRYRDEIAKHLGDRASFLPDALMLPLPSSVAAAGLRILRGEAPPEPLVPRYVRPSQAELKQAAHRGG